MKFNIKTTTPMTKGPMPHMPYSVTKTTDMTKEFANAIKKNKQRQAAEAHSLMMADSYDRNLQKFRKQK